MFNFKNILSLSLSIATLGLPSLTYADAPKDPQNQVGAQLTLTRSAIDQLLERVHSNGVQVGGFDQADYAIKSKGFQATVAKAAEVFEASLSNSKDGILVQAQAMIARYDELYESTQYPDDLKKSLLQSQLVYIDGFANTLSLNYQTQLKALFNAPGLDIFKFGHLGESNDGDPTLYPFLSNDCYSQSCVSSSTFDEVNYISLVKELFNKEMSFKMEGGSLLEIHPFERSSSNYRQQPFDLLFREALQEISSTVGFPGFDQLPVGISSDDLQKKIAHNQLENVVLGLMIQRQAGLKKIDDYLDGLYPNKGNHLKDIDGFLREVCSVSLARPDLVTRVGGCVSASEITHFENHRGTQPGWSSTADKWNRNFEKEAAKIAAEFHWSK